MDEEQDDGKRKLHEGLEGVLKKLGYWIVIVVAFGASAVFIEIGLAIGIDLGITTLLGWFVLASLIINEIGVHSGEFRGGRVQCTNYFGQGIGSSR